MSSKELFKKLIGNNDDVVTMEVEVVVGVITPKKIAGKQGNSSASTSSQHSKFAGN